MKLTIQFYSAWAIGSGKGGDSKDSIILKDDDGLPFIPGRTLKGLIRDAFLECYTKDEDKDDAVALFGQVKPKKENKDETVFLTAGKLRFNSAYLSDDYKNLSKELKGYLFNTKTSTRLEKEKQAKDHSLRKDEVCIPLELTSSILVKEDHSELNKDEFDKIEKALKMLKILGEKRHRGLGRVLITAEESDERNSSDNDDKTNTTVLITAKKSDERDKNNANAENNTANEITKNTIRFSCEVTEPLILVKKAKTGQNIESLDYIPGNTFRGIVAGAIFNGDKKKFNDIIFNNTVQFGDAHLVIDNKRSLKTPFSFYYDKKTDDDKLYNFHCLEDEDWTDMKLKSQKKGYLVETANGLTIKNIEYGNRIKSSRNRDKRSSEKGGMFSYHYIKKGQMFEFEVTSANTTYLAKIVEILNAKTKYFGKSKSAEFGGAIKISFLGKKEPIKPNFEGKYLYAESNLCFLNDYGEFTTTPTPKQLTGNKDNIIDWDNSQVKHRTFAPYNFHRENYDFERLIIEKGSVFAFKKEIELGKGFCTKSLGCFLTEGYGQVLVSPSFLGDREVKFNMDTPSKETPTNGSKDLVIKFIEAKHKVNQTEIKIDESVENYVKKFSKKDATSQWARVFNATTRAKNYDELDKLLYNTKIKKTDRDQSIFNGGLNKWNENDINKVTAFFKEEAVKDNKILALRKLAKQMISRTKNQK